MMLKHVIVGTLLAGMCNWSTVAASRLGSHSLRGRFKNYTNEDVFDIGEEGWGTKPGPFPWRPGKYLDESRHLQEEERKRLRQHKRKKGKSVKSNSKANKPKSSKTTTPLTIPVCSGEDYIACGDEDGYFICVNADTVCSDDPSLISHVENERDYCGQCSVSGQFISQSIVTSIDPISSTEYVSSSSGDVFETEYDAVFNDFGLISLAASQDLIVQVDCANVGDMQGSITIDFEEDIEADRIEKMFPLGSLVVVDGEVFGSCDISGEGSITLGPSQNGFLLIESVSSSAKEVYLSGEVGSINYIFEKLSISYSPMDRRLISFNTTERRNLAGASFSASYSLVEPEDSPITITSTLAASGSSFIGVSHLDWSFFSRSYDIACDFGFELNTKLVTTVVFDISGTVIPFDRDFPSKKKDWKRFPIYSLAVASAIELAVNYFLPKNQAVDLSLGLFVTLPMNINMEAEQNFNLELGGFEADATTGQKHMQFIASSDETPQLVSVVDEPFDIGAERTDMFGEDLNDALDHLNVNMKLKGFAGFKPQIEFTTFGLARGSLGVHAGLFFDADFDYPDKHDPVEDSGFLPMTFGVCESCHHLHISLDAGVADPFLSYKLLTDKKDTEVDIGSFDPKTIDLMQVCLLEDPCIVNPNNDVTVDIEPLDSILLGNGGLPNTEYFIVLTANNVPDNIAEVRFEYYPGLGVADSFMAPVVDGVSSITASTSYSKAGSYVFTSSVFNAQDELATKSITINIAGTMLDINPPGLKDAEVGEEYSFHFMASGIQSTTSNVKFTWSFGASQSAAGTSDAIPVTSGEATFTVSHIYTAIGAYGVVAAVEDVETGDTMATHSVTVAVGPTTVNNYSLDICNTWSVSSSGGEGVTFDSWDISEIPLGAVLDIEYDAHSRPDKFLVDYPVGNPVLDTGWRGLTSYSGDLFPGGITAPGDDSVANVFTRLTPDTFQVTIIGPDPLTIWDYKVLCRSASSATKEVTYLEDSTSSLINPERGFYTPYEYHADEPLGLRGLFDTATLEYTRESTGQSVIVWLVHLDIDSGVKGNIREDQKTDNFGGLIRDDVLDDIEAGFASMRAAGVKCVLRFIYYKPISWTQPSSDFCERYPEHKHICKSGDVNCCSESDVKTIVVSIPDPNGGPNEIEKEVRVINNDVDENKRTCCITEPPKDEILAHISQLTSQPRSILPGNQDLILAVQAGFVGPWGEFHTSTHFADDEVGRKDIVKALLDAVPERDVQVRYPRLKMKELTFEAGTDYLSRTGHYNDCFLASENDYGTYTDGKITDEKYYLASDTEGTAMGGETCGVNKPRTECTTAMEELAMFHYTYLNRDYHEDVLDTWALPADQCLGCPCFDEIANRLGYRLVLQNGEYGSGAPPAGIVPYSIKVRNVGFAAPVNAHLVQLVLRGTTGSIVCYGKSIDDMRTWYGGDEKIVTGNLQLPADIPEGTYYLFLNLADESNRLRFNSKYNIKVANIDLNEPDTGLIDLKHSVTVATSLTSANSNSGETIQVACQVIGA